MKKIIFSNIYQFYRYDCCWPYAVSFLLVLVIYWFDFFIIEARIHAASLVGYGIIFAYYLYNVFLYNKGKLKAKDLEFFIRFLSVKVIIWGFLLILLYFV